MLRSSHPTRQPLLLPFMSCSERLGNFSSIPHLANGKAELRTSEDSTGWVCLLVSCCLQQTAWYPVDAP